MLPAQDKHSSHVWSGAQINLLAYELAKTQQLARTWTHQIAIARTHQLFNPSTIQLINHLTHQPINLQTHKLTNCSTHKLINLQTHDLTSLSNNQLINKSTHKLTNSLPHNRISSSVHQLPTSQNLICCFNFTISFWFSLRSSEYVGGKVGKKPHFLAFHGFCFVRF